MYMHQLFQYNLIDAQKDVITDCYRCREEGHLAECGEPGKLLQGRGAGVGF